MIPTSCLNFYGWWSPPQGWYPTPWWYPAQGWSPPQGWYPTPWWYPAQGWSPQGRHHEGVAVDVFFGVVVRDIALGLNDARF